jgi:hypothetical protein
MNAGWKRTAVTDIITPPKRSVNVRDGVVMHENKIRPRRSTGAVNEGRMRPFIHVVPAKDQKMREVAQPIKTAVGLGFKSVRFRLLGCTEDSVEERCSRATRALTHNAGNKTSQISQ